MNFPYNDFHCSVQTYSKSRSLSVQDKSVALHSPSDSVINLRRPLSGSLWNLNQLFRLINLFATIFLCAMSMESLRFAPNCLLMAEVLWVSWGCFWFYRRKAALFIPQCFISARHRHRSLLQNCGDTECVFERERQRESMCVRESSGGAMWYLWGPGLVFVWNQAWCLVSSANISSARLPSQLHSSSESSVAALLCLLNLFQFKIYK